MDTERQEETIRLGVLEQQALSSILVDIARLAGKRDMIVKEILANRQFGANCRLEIVNLEQGMVKVIILNQ